MQAWKQWKAGVRAYIEAHFNRALLLSILACLVILLTYLLGGAGAFVSLRQWLFPTGDSSALAVNAGKSSSASHSGSTAPSASHATSPAATAPSVSTSTNAGSSPVSVAGSVTLPLQVSPLDLPLDCALGAAASGTVTLSNPDSAPRTFSLAWNGTSSSIAGFSTTVQGSGMLNTVPAHGTRLVSVAVVPLSLDPHAASQYLWVTDDTGGASTVVAKVHVTCATLPLPTATLPALPIPTVALPIPTVTLPTLP